MSERMKNWPSVTFSRGRNVNGAANYVPNAKIEGCLHSKVHEFGGSWKYVEKSDEARLWAAEFWSPLQITISLNAGKSIRREN